jgi:signal transduction histidine kinase
MNRRRSLLSKVIVGVSVAVLVIDGLLLVPTSVLYREELIQAKRETTALVARILLHHDEGRLERDGEAALPSLAEELERHRADLGDTTAVVFDAAGRFVAGGAGATPREEAAVAAMLAAWTDRTRERTLEEPGYLVLGVPVFAGAARPGPIGLLVLAAPLDGINGKIASHVLLAMGLVLIILLFVGATTISALYVYVLRPIDELTRANRALVLGDEKNALVPPERIPEDEIGDVIRSRNEIYLRMLEYQASIRDKNEILRRQGLELKRWALELEGRVREKQRELERAHERLLESEKLAVAGRLAAGIAHEINNPLASIAGYAEDLLSLARDPALRDLHAFRDFPESLAVIEAQAYRCKRIIRQLLSFARPAPFRIEAVPLGPLIAEVLPLVEHRTRGRDVAILTDVDPDCPPALADRTNLMQVLVNLLENAFDAIEQPGGRVTVAVEHLAADGPVVAIQVRDTGSGIPPSIRSKVFEPFFTTKPVGRGTGLGLSIVHSIVSRLEGTVDFVSEPGKGTVFTITLPAAAAAPAGAGAAAGGGAESAP